MIELTNKKQVIEALGGTAGIMKLTGLEYRAAHGMKYGKTFPCKYYLIMLQALEREGKSAPSSLWGMR